MNHAITVGDLFWPAIAIGGLVLFVIVISIILNIFANAWKD